jgi:diacylglycerol kinase (ATP)
MYSPTPIAIILNPTAGRGRAARAFAAWRPELEARLGACVVFETKASRDAVTLTRDALRQGHTKLLSVGGDGTHFEVTNGYFNNFAPVNPDASIAYLPLGTGSDFTRSLHMLRSQEGMLHAMERWDTRLIDVVQLDLCGPDGAPASWVFQNIARAGAGAEVVARAEQSGKHLGGFLTFLIATIKTVLAYRDKPMRVEIDGEVFERKVKDLVIANGGFDGGGMRSAPFAKLDNGLLDAYIYGEIGLLDALLNLNKIYTGRMMDRPDVVTYRQPHAITASCTEQVLVEADGELVGTLPATFKVMPKQLRAVVGPHYPTSE